MTHRIHRSMISFLIVSSWLLPIISLLVTLSPHCLPYAAAAADASDDFIETHDDLNKDDDVGVVLWNNLSVFRKKKTLILLHPFSFALNAGNVCGVIGPSGSGKSTLLNAVAGTTLSSSGLEVSGSVSTVQRGRYRALDMRFGHVAFLQQEDAFFSMLTPYESLMLAAKLEYEKKGYGYDKDNIRQEVDGLLRSLGLWHVRHRRIGDRGGDGGNNKQSGCLSGGERRRLSVAIELVGTDPKLFLADEPTTGLDSSQAEKVVSLIARVAKEKKVPVLCTLHQPRASIWKKLDSFILLAPGGRIAYAGPRMNAKDYFAKLGYTIPMDTNPAEFFIDLVSVDSEDPMQAEIDNERINHLTMSYSKHMATTYTQSSCIDQHEIDGKLQRYNFFSLRYVRRFVNLFVRSWRQNVRDTRLNITRLIASIGQSFLFAQIFKTVKKGAPTAKSVADRIALLSYGVINMSMLALMKAIDLFSREKNVIMRERMRNQYNPAEYLCSKVTAEFPLDTLYAIIFASALKWRTGLRCSWKVLTITYSLMTVAGVALGFAIGGLAPDGDTAKAAGMPIMVLMMVMGIINPSGVDSTIIQPIYIQFLKLISPIRWAIEGLCISEYKGMEFSRKGYGLFKTIASDAPKMGAMAMVQNGDQVLNALGLQESTWEQSMHMLGRLTGANILISLLGLKFCGPSFVTRKCPATSKKTRTNSSSGNNSDE